MDLLFAKLLSFLWSSSLNLFFLFKLIPLLLWIYSWLDDG